MAALTMKPHTVQILPPDAPVDTVDNEVETTVFSRGRTIACRVMPIAPDVAFQMFGVEVKSPHKLLCELADAPTDEQNNARVRYSGTWYRIRGILRHTTTVLKHAAILLEREN